MKPYTCNVAQQVSNNYENHFDTLINLMKRNEIKFYFSTFAAIQTLNMRTKNKLIETNAI